MPSILQVIDLTKTYDNGVHAVKGISFLVDSGEVFGILGPNGAGKTTTLEMIKGLRSIISGTVISDGIKTAGQPYLVKQHIGNLDRQLTHSSTVLDVKSEGVTTNNLGYFDFILPGILSMTIMQLGIFGVAFSFVALKASGALRRIQATPVHPVYFVFAQATVRLLITLATAFVLIAFGTYFFNFHMMCNYFNFAIISIIGILIFLGIGFAIAGWAKDETQVAPVANLVQLPMLLLSGIFFSRDGFPSWLRSITDYFPLTYVSHGLRRIANQGASLADLSVDLIGMGVWLILVY